MDYNVSELIQKLSGTFNKDFVQLMACTVNSVDPLAFTCQCTAISGDSATDITAVQLNAEANDGLIVFPAVGSTVIVANSTRNGYYVFMYSDITGVSCVIDGNNSYNFDSNGFVFNGGALGGIGKTSVISSQLNNVETAINQLKAAVILINAAASSSPSTPVTNATLAGFLAGISVVLLSLTTQPLISDTKVQH